MCGPVYDHAEPTVLCALCTGQLYLTPTSREPFCPNCIPAKRLKIDYDEHVGAIQIKLPNGNEMFVHLPPNPTAPVSVSFWKSFHPGEYPHRSNIYYFHVDKELE